MEINKLSQTQPSTIELKKQPERIKETGLKEDAFQKEEDKFDLEDAKKFLTELKTSDGFKKFNIPKVADEILENVSKEPKKWGYVKDLAQKENISPFFIKTCSANSVEDLKEILEFANVKDFKGKDKFSTSDIEKIRLMEPAQINNVKALQNTALTSSNVILAAQEKGLNCIKTAQKVDEMTALIGKDDLSEIEFARNEYSKGDYKIVAKDSNGNSTKELLDNNLDRYALEKTTSYVNKDGKEYRIKKSADYRNNTTSKIRVAKNEAGVNLVETEIRIVKDKNGKTHHTEYTEPSAVKGVMDVKYVYPDGKVEQISSGTIDKKTGITSIKKNMVSSLGTKTEYLFENDPMGNRISDYKITDKDGNVLLNNSESFEVLDKNHFISAKNNQRYEIIVDDLEESKSEYSLTVKDLNNPERVETFKTQKEIFGNYKEMIKVLKQMPGEELFKLKEDTSKLVGEQDILSAYSRTTASTREIHAGNDLFVILHELGHAVDMKDVDMIKEKETINKAIFEDKKFNEIYEKEKAAFNKEFPNAQRDHISYFINHETHYNGEIGARKETIAESNALLTTAKSHEVLAMRSQYLQQHFPETIAYLDTKLAEPTIYPDRKYAPEVVSEWSGH